MDNQEFIETLLDDGLDNSTIIDFVETQNSEIVELRAKLAAMESQEPVAYMVKVLNPSSSRPALTVFSKVPNGRKSDFPAGFKLAGAYENTPLYAKPLPAGRPATKTLDSPARVNHTVFGKGVFHSTVVDAAQRYYQHMKEPQPDAETLASAQREMRQFIGMPKAEPAVAVPDGWKLVPCDPTRDMISAFSIAATDVKTWRDAPEDQKIEAIIQIGKCWSAMLAAAPSHSQQSAVVVPDGFSLVPIERSYDMRTAAFLHYNTAKGNGKDHDDSLDAAWRATIEKAYSPKVIDRCQSHDSEGE